MYDRFKSRARKPMVAYPDGSVLVRSPSAPLSGRIRPPGSKSITNRALLLAGVASGISRLDGVLHSDDTAYMGRALEALGVGIEARGRHGLTVHGTARLQIPAAPLFLGNAGTATRFLVAMAACVDGEVTVTGDTHMQRRPIAPLVNALRQLGVEASAPSGCPPVVIRGTGGFDATTVSIDAGLSSQYVSAILMLAPFARTTLTVAIDHGDIDARGYIDLTLAVMRAFGARVEASGATRWRVQGGGYRATDFRIEPDASAATYLWGAEVLTGGRIDLGIDPERMSQPDAAAYELIRRFPHLPPEIDGSQMQDAVPTLAVLAAFNDTPVRFVGIGNLRVKECDRIRALATEIGKLGREMTVEEDAALTVAGRAALTDDAVAIDSWADHRIAMSLALAGLGRVGVEILDPGCVAKTYPRFWDDLAALGVDLEWR